MFVVSITYKKPLSEVDQFIEAHAAYLEKYYAAGVFVLSGRKEPRTGGVILAKTDNREILDNILQEDPFNTEGLADYQVTEFLPTMAAPNLASLLTHNAITR